MVEMHRAAERGREVAEKEKAVKANSPLSRLMSATESDSPSVKANVTKKVEDPMRLVHQQVEEIHPVEKKAEKKAEPAAPKVEEAPSEEPGIMAGLHKSHSKKPLPPVLR